jgi:hypothetical protein
MSGNGPSTKTVNVSENKALAIAAVLNFEQWESMDPTEIGAMFITMLTAEVTMRDVLALAQEVE